MKYDFNKLEEKAEYFINEEKYGEAINIYYFMADGDTSLDAGYLGEKIGFCYEKMGFLHAARYWYGRAVEENPTISRYIESRSRLEDLNIDYLIL